MERLDLDNNSRSFVCLPDKSEHVAADDNETGNSACYIAGWGQTGVGVPPRLRSAKVNIFSAAFCSANTHFGNTQPFEPEDEFCAGYMEGEIDTCQGDSGGPLICIVNDTPILYGVTSWGIGCGDANSPGIYAKVSSYIGWISKTIKDDSPTVIHLPIKPSPSTENTGSQGMPSFIHELKFHFGCRHVYRLFTNFPFRAKYH